MSELDCTQIRGYVTWIDTAKGLGILLVFIEHLWYGSNLPIIITAIYSFHMPLFFILSGFVAHTQRDSLGSYVKKQFFRLLLPALIFLTISIPLYLWKLDSWVPVEIIRRITFWDGQVPYNDPLWFFIVLFELKIVDRLLDISGENKKAKLRSAYCVLLSDL